LACERPDLIDLLSGTCRHRISRNNNDDSESNRKNVTITDKTDKPVAPSKMKMPVDRCVALMLSCNEIEIDKSRSVTTTIVTTTITVSRSLIALQPSLLYTIQQWFLGFAATYFGNRWTQTGAIVERGIRFVRSSLVAEANQNVDEQR
jgi:hypothetical protein